MEPEDDLDALTEDDLRALLAAERANSAHWRWTAERRISADRTLVERPLIRAAIATDRRIRRVANRIRGGGDRSAAPDGLRPVDTERDPWTGDGPARFVITICASDLKVARGWGDWHIAHGLADALKDRGHTVDLQALDAAARGVPAAFDVEVVVRGLAPVPGRSARRQVLWVISHPESVTGQECDDADLVLTGSGLHALRLRQITDTPVDVMLQATDPDHFRPGARRHDQAREVVVVAKTRGVFRPIVRDAVAAGLRPTVHGSGWHKFIDPALIASERVSYDDLPTVYASAGVVLNDHWDTMRAWRFVSNRIFDALACGTPVVSDPVPGLEALFGNAVRTASTPEEVGRAVRGLLADPAAAASVSAEARRTVVEHHTFDHRADELLDLLAQREPDPHSS